MAFGANINENSLTTSNKACICGLNHWQSICGVIVLRQHFPPRHSSLRLNHQRPRSRNGGRVRRSYPLDRDGQITDHSAQKSPKTSDSREIKILANSETVSLYSPPLALEPELPPQITHDSTFRDINVSDRDPNMCRGLSRRQIFVHR